MGSRITVCHIWPVGCAIVCVLSCDFKTHGGGGGGLVRGHPYTSCPGNTHILSSVD